MRLHVLVTCCVLMAGSAFAAPPPPPPAYIYDTVDVLTADVTPQNLQKYSAVFADDLRVFLNGVELASDKATWITFQEARIGRIDRRVIGHSEGLDSLMIVERYDDRSALPVAPGLIFDPRYLTRVERYQFGSDHLIHELRIVEGGGMVWRPGA